MAKTIYLRRGLFSLGIVSLVLFFVRGCWIGLRFLGAKFSRSPNLCRVVLLFLLGRLRLSGCLVLIGLLARIPENRQWASAQRGVLTTTELELKAVAAARWKFGSRGIHMKTPTATMRVYFGPPQPQTVVSENGVGEYRSATCPPRHIAFQANGKDTFNRIRVLSRNGLNESTLIASIVDEKRPERHEFKDHRQLCADRFGLPTRPEIVGTGAKLTGKINGMGPLDCEYPVPMLAAEISAYELPCIQFVSVLQRENASFELHPFSNWRLVPANSTGHRMKVKW